MRRLVDEIRLYMLDSRLEVPREDSRPGSGISNVSRRRAQVLDFNFLVPVCCMSYRMKSSFPPVDVNITASRAFRNSQAVFSMIGAQPWAANISVLVLKV